MAEVLCCGTWSSYSNSLSQDAPVSCRHVASATLCEALLGDPSALTPLGLAAADLVVYNPGWDQVVWPWLVLPVIYRISCCLCSRLLLRPLYFLLISKSSTFRDLIVNYVGRSSAAPNPTRPYPLVFMGIAQLVFSMATMALFVLKTNLREHATDGSWRPVEIILGSFFVLHWLILVMKEEFVVKDSIFEFSTIVDCLTVPQLLTGAKCGTMSLGFLRTYRALYTYERLETLNSLGVIHFWSSASDFQRVSLLTLLRFLSLIVLYAGSILVLEVLGEPPFIVEHLDHTSMGDISFFTLFYWVIETISTVGYGDYAPKTVPSKCVTMLCMVSGVLFFAIETTKFAEIYGLRLRGTGAFKKGSRDHVVVLGSAVQQLDEGILTAFFSEIYHPDYKMRWPSTVMLVSTDVVVARVNGFVSTRVDWEARSLITVLQGSAVIAQDLARCQCHSAVVVYILTDTLGRSGLSSQEEDKRNILRALSVRRACPRIPLRLLLLRPDSKMQATNAGIPPKRCFALNELKALLFWQSSRCIGWSTFICNLILTLGAHDLMTLTNGSPKGRAPPSKWRQGYAEGVKYLIFGLVPAQSLRKGSFLDLVKMAHHQTGMIIFAAQIKGDVVLAPFHLLNDIDEDTVVFALARNESDLDTIADKTQDWRHVFYRNRFQKFAEDEQKSTKAILKRAGLGLAARKAAREQSRELGWKPASPCERLKASRHFGLPVSELDDMLKEPLLGDDMSNGAELIQNADSEPNMVRLNTPQATITVASAHPAQDQLACADMCLTFEERADQIRKNSSTQPFTTFIELSTTWEHAATFIRESRQKWLPERTPLIIQSSVAPTLRLVSELRLMDDPDVGVIIGSSKQLSCLLNAGVHEASVVVCPAVDKIDLASTDTSDPEALAMVDADAVVVYQTLDAIGVTLRAMMLFEFKRVQNACLLPGRGKELDWSHGQEATSSQVPRRRFSTTGGGVGKRFVGNGNTAVGNGELLAENNKPSLPSRLWSSFLSEGPKPSTFQATLCNHPRYISGRIFTSECLGSLLARACYIPGIMEVIETLIVPQADVFIWQMHARDSMVGRDFGACWAELLSDQDGPALALGLYRFLVPSEEATEEDPPVGFVFTSPSSDTVLRADDLVYVLAPKEWGHRVKEAGYLYSGR